MIIIQMAVGLSKTLPNEAKKDLLLIVSARLAACSASAVVVVSGVVVSGIIVSEVDVGVRVVSEVGVDVGVKVGFGIALIV